MGCWWQGKGAGKILECETCPRFLAINSAGAGGDRVAGVRCLDNFLGQAKKYQAIENVNIFHFKNDIGNYLMQCFASNRMAILR